MSEASGEVASLVEQAREQSEKVIERIYAATQPGAVFAAPVVSGAYTVIMAGEVVAGGGFGFGTGTGPMWAASRTSGEGGGTPQMAGGGGAGGGGGSMGRPVAAIVIGPDGVKVRPIIDPTKIALAAITAWGSVAFTLMRWARGRKR